MATSNGKSKKRIQKEADKDLSKTYNQFKEFEGQVYTAGSCIKQAGAMSNLFLSN